MVCKTVNFQISIFLPKPLRHTDEYADSCAVDMFYTTEIYNNLLSLPTDEVFEGLP
jgi:hypothetical protein